MLFLEFQHPNIIIERHVLELLRATAKKKEVHLRQKYKISHFQSNYDKCNLHL
jgi:hypothetical protein